MTVPLNNFDGAAPARIPGAIEDVPEPLVSIKTGDMDAPEKQVSFVPAFGLGEIGGKPGDHIRIKAVLDI